MPLRFRSPVYREPAPLARADGWCKGTGVPGTSDGSAPPDWTSNMVFGCPVCGDSYRLHKTTGNLVRHKPVAS